MNKNTTANKTQQILIGITIIGSLCILLRIAFEVSYLSIVVMLGIALVSIVASRYSTGFTIPGKFLFRVRFIVYGFGFGLMIGLVVIISKPIILDDFSILRFLIMLLIGGLLGIVIKGWSSYLRFMKLKKEALALLSEEVILCDNAVFNDSNFGSNRGLLFLTETQLMFYSPAKKKFINISNLTEVKPQIEKSKIASIPQGFRLSGDEYSIRIAFPLLWIKMLTR